MTGLDLSVAKTNMITNQVKAWEVTNERVLALLASAPREAYVPVAYRNLAYADMEIEIGFGQRMFAPKVEARFLQALQVQPGDRILEIGTGSGYMAALLAGLGERVTSIEIVPQLAAGARKVLENQMVLNVSVVEGDGSRGWSSDAPYDVIMVTGSLEVWPEEFLDMLKPGGRLGAVIGRSPVMHATLVTRTDEGFLSEKLFETDLAPLVNAKKQERFSF